jgi:hypothetical protein
VPYRTKALEILDQWRAVERLLAEAPDQNMRVELEFELERLKRDYQATVEAASDARMPLPPPFPELAADPT